MAGAAWTNEELEFLRNNFESKSCAEIAVRLGRTTRSVQHKFGQLGLLRKQPEVGDTVEGTRLTILRKYFKFEHNQNKTYAWVKCNCEKQTEFEVKLASLTSGNTKSCKCLQSEIQRERAIERNTKHGQSQNPDNELYKKWTRMKYNSGVTVCPEWQEYLDFEKWSLENGYEKGMHIYRIDEDDSYNMNNCLWHNKGFYNERLYHTWIDIIRRCENSNCKAYKNYGGRGIVICAEWRKDYFTFKKWALNNGYNDSLTIERKEVNGNYEPENCTWVPFKEQSRNRRDSQWITAFGEEKLAYDWSKDIRCNVNSSTIVMRIEKGWQPALAITTPPYIKPLD